MKHHQKNSKILAFFSELAKRTELSILRCSAQRYIEFLMELHEENTITVIFLHDTILQWSRKGSVQFSESD